MVDGSSQPGTQRVLIAPEHVPVRSTTSAPTASSPPSTTSPRPSQPATTATTVTTTTVAPPASTVAPSDSRGQAGGDYHALRAPRPISAHRCGGTIGVLIEATFGPAGPWAESIAWRESNCIPSARNGSSGSEGLFQLYRHDGILAAVCPNQPPSASWAVPACNVAAAYRLYLAAGTRPWAL